MPLHKPWLALLTVGCSVFASAVTSADVVAADPCDALPTSASKLKETVKISDALCNVSCAAPPGLALPAAPFKPPMTLAPNAKFDYVDQWHGACQLSVGTGTSCKLDTTCAPGETRFADNGVWKCKGTKLESVTFNPRQECKNKLPPPQLQVEAGLYSVIRETPILSRAGKELCTVGGGGYTFIKGTNLHLVDAVQVNDPEITLAVYTDAEHLNKVKVIVKHLGRSARLGEHLIELSSWAGRTKTVAKIQVEESTATICPSRPSGRVPVTRSCSSGDPGCNSSNGSVVVGR